VPCGHPPVLRRITKRREVSSLVAVTARLDGATPRLYARHFLGTVRTPDLIAGLRYFHARIGRPLIIVWDHLSTHRARAVRDFLARHATDFRVEWLPGYAPELNPEEACNNCVKLAMTNVVPHNDEELCGAARLNFQRLGRKPHLLRHFFAYAHLDVN
jgi:transposase